MTPMIDVVFQLIAFFMFTLRVVTVEGDFSITMPIQGSGPAESPLSNTLAVRLTANPATGELQQVYLNGEPQGAGQAGIGRLNQMVRETVYPGGQRSVLAPDMEAELDFDYELDYRWVVQALSAVSGEPDPQDPRRVIRYVENIRLAQPRPRQAG